MRILEDVSDLLWYILHLTVQILIVILYISLFLALIFIIGCLGVSIYTTLAHGF